MHNFIGLHHLMAGMNVGFILDPTFGWVLLVAAIMGLEILVFGFVFAGRVRGQVFTEEFMKKHFGEIHKEATGQQIKKEGNPDMGSGFYSQKLSYADWYKFNNGQRVHQNFVEFAPSTYAFLLIAGVYFPIVAAALGLGVIIGRIFYGIGYFSTGPSGRLIGVIVGDLALLALFILSIISAVYWIQGNQITGQISS